MKEEIVIGSDHAGFRLKEDLKIYLSSLGYAIKDMGTYAPDRCDYPKVAYAVARLVADSRMKKGILVCYTGIGNSIVVNRVPGVRGALCYNLKAARLSREHNDSNILVLGAAFINSSIAKRITKTWLNTSFIGGRHKRRINQIDRITKKVQGV